jgi:hypothetical protein
MDLPDDFHLIIDPSTIEAGFYFNKSVLNSNNWYSTSYLQNIARTSLSKKDTEPDEFSFNFMGYSGKFYYTHTGEWKVICNRPVVVSFNSQFLDPPFILYGQNLQHGQFRSFSGFRITTEDGTRYIFAGSTPSIEYSMDFFSHNFDNWTAGSWFLTQIRTIGDSEIINFTYERDDFINQMYMALYNDLGTSTVSSEGPLALEHGCSSNGYTPIYGSYSGKLIATVYLSAIQTTSHKVKF